MPLATTPAVRLQLINLENEVCLEASFSNPTKNTAQDFKATSD
jgi:hypothetical protein